MDFSEIVGLLPADKQAEAKAFIESYQKSAMAKPRDRAEAAKIFETDDLIKAELDSRVSKAVASHDEKIKRETVPGLVEEELKKRNPSKSPQEKAIEELNSKLAEMEKAAKLKDQKLRAIAKLQEKGVPNDLVDAFVGLDDSETDEKITTYISTFDKYGASLIEKTKKELIGQGTPGNGKPASGKPQMKRADFVALPPREQADAVKKYELID